MIGLFPSWQNIPTKPNRSSALQSLTLPCGVRMGITSTFAHGAGPVAAMFLMPQRLPEETGIRALAHAASIHCLLKTDVTADHTVTRLNGICGNDAADSFRRLVATKTRSNVSKMLRGL